MLKYNVLLQDRHALPVHSVVMLLRTEADSKRIDDRSRTTFRMAAAIWSSATE